MTYDADLLAKIARGMVTRSPQTKALGFEPALLDPPRPALRVPWREDLVGDPDTEVISGGVITTLLDHVCGLAILAKSNGVWTSVTLDLRIDYMRAAAPRAAVIGEAVCYRLGRSVAFVRGMAYDADPEDPIATAQGAFMLHQRTDRDPG